MELEGSGVEGARGSGGDERRKGRQRDGKARGNITGGGQPLVSSGLAWLSETQNLK